MLRPFAGALSAEVVSDCQEKYCLYEIDSIFEVVNKHGRIFAEHCVYYYQYCAEDYYNPEERSGENCDATA